MKNSIESHCFWVLLYLLNSWDIYLSFYFLFLSCIYICLWLAGWWFVWGNPYSIPLIIHRSVAQSLIWRIIHLSIYSSMLKLRLATQGREITSKQLLSVTQGHINRCHTFSLIKSRNSPSRFSKWSTTTLLKAIVFGFFYT